MWVGESGSCRRPSEWREGEQTPPASGRGGEAGMCRTGQGCKVEEVGSGQLGWRTMQGGSIAHCAAPTAVVMAVGLGLSEQQGNGSNAVSCEHD